MTESRRPNALWALVVSVMLGIFALDRGTGATPVQHLYYVPIILAAVRLGRWAGPTAAAGAVVLYHLANPVLLSTPYKEADLVQVALFLGIGAVAARFAHDARLLRQLAETDDLTGLYNLRGYEARLAGVLRASRKTKTPVALLVLDVDRLKSLNDVHGHRAGADAVRLVGHLLATHLPRNAIACRFGGDEFVVAMPGCNPVAAIDAADDLRSAVQASAPILAELRFPTETLSISIGLACLTYDDGETYGPSPADDAETAEILFRAADQQLYAAKNAGRNRIAIARGERPPSPGIR